MTPQGYPLWLATATTAAPRQIQVGRVIGWTEGLDPVVLWTDTGQIEASALAPGVMRWVAETPFAADEQAHQALWMYCPSGHGKLERPDDAVRVWVCPVCDYGTTRAA